LKLGKKIDEKPYSLPGPEIGRLTLADPIGIPPNPDLKGAVSAYPPEAPPISVESQSLFRQEFKVFEGKKVMLSADLGLGSRLRGTVEDLIASGGGSVTGSIHKADIFVCQYREGSDYTTAARAGKEVGNLTWLYYLITNNTWTSPMRRLLHYPIARGGLPGFEKFKITLSNYGGDARLYLENLVIAAGGQYTKNMKQDNTHLITARSYSEKCAAAQEWGIHMVNHLWLEESYAKWQIQSLTNPRYTHFPHRTNLGEVAGQTQIDRKALEKIFYAVDQDMTSDDDGGNPLNELEMKQLSKGPPGSFNTPTHKGRKAPKNSGSLKTPTNNRLTGHNENEPPSTTSSRGAKERAVAKLHDLAPDIALYEKEKKRVGGVVRGGRRLADAELGGGKKRSPDRGDQGGPDTDNPRQAKKAKPSKPPVTVRLLLTGYKRWVNSPKMEDEERVCCY
jgi:twin BRCT domain